MSYQINQLLARAIQDFQSGKFDEAEYLLRQVLQAQSKNFDALHILGVVRGIKNQHQEALELFRKALRIDPSNSFLNFNIAKVFSEIGEDDKAIKYHLTAVKLNPTHPEGWLSYGKSLSNLRKYEESLDCYIKALDLRPDYAEAWTNRGCVLTNLRRYEEALASFDESLKINSQIAETWSNRGNALQELRRFEEALASYDQAIRIKLEYAEAWSNRGNALQELSQFEEALASNDQAIRIQPEYAEAWCSRGVAMVALGRHDEAMAPYGRSLQIKPNYAKALCNMGFLQLLKQDFLGGFENYRSRWDANYSSSVPLQTTVPRCRPGPLAGEVLLWAEQGVGDEILYAGLLPAALNPSSRVTLSADLRLHSIFKRSFPGVALIDRKRTASEIFDGGFDAQAPIGDLGHLLRVDADQIQRSRQPYLVPDVERVSQLRADLPFPTEKLVCGIAWRSANQKFGAEKSVHLTELEPLFANADLSFVNLQYGDVGAEIRQASDLLKTEIHQVQGLDVFNDIDGLLALIEACDLVITTSNLTAHLAGSLGKRGCVIVPFAKGRIWYWHLSDTFSLWYPSLRVFYQQDPKSWSSTISEVADWVKRSV
jgi:tetratricopeptide (TPR) repeat protein